MLKRTILILLLLFTSFGCASLKQAKTEPQVHFFRYEGLDLTWREERAGDDLRMYGIFRNYLGYPVLNLNLVAHLLDEDGREIFAKSYPGFPITVSCCASLPFELTFPLPPGERNERVYFTFDYYLRSQIEEYHVYQKVPCLDTFASPL